MPSSGQLGDPPATDAGHATGDTVLRPRYHPRSLAARWLGWLALPIIGIVIALDSLLTANGAPPETRARPIQWLLGLAVLGPGALWMMGPLLGRIPGLGWLVDRAPLSLRLEHGGYALTHGSIVRTGRWLDVDRIVLVEGEWGTADFVLKDGTRLRLPSELLRAVTDRGAQTTLLDELDRVVPHLARADARRRTQMMIVVGVLAFLALAGGIAAAILLTR